MLRNYASSFSETELDFFKFQKHENGWGARYPGQSIFTPTLSSLHTTQHDTSNGENKD